MNKSLPILLILSLWLSLSSFTIKDGVRLYQPNEKVEFDTIPYMVDDKYFIQAYAQDFLKFVNRKTNDTITINITEIEKANENGIRLYENAANKLKGVNVSAAYINIKDSNKWVKIPMADVLASAWKRYGDNVFLRRESVLASIQSNSILYYGPLIYNELVLRNFIRKKEETIYNDIPDNSNKDFIKFLKRNGKDTITISLCEIDTATIHYIQLTESAASRLKGVKVISSYINIQDSSRWERIGLIDIRASYFRGLLNMFLTRDSYLSAIQHNRITYRGLLIYNELVLRGIIRKEDAIEYPYKRLIENN